MTARRPFRDHHLLEILEIFEDKSIPLDLCLNHYFREHTSLGSKDRLEVAETIYAIIRWKGLLDHLCLYPPTWEKRLNLFKEDAINKNKNNETIPDAIRLSFPIELFDCLVESHGLEKAKELCLTCNIPAPTTIRVNTLKITRDALFKSWEKLYNIKPTSISPHGITFDKKISLFSLDEYKKGFFEIQDEGSQLLSHLIEAKPGQRVMDYCAGSGGKTLGFAPSMNGTGQIYLHDIRPWALQDAKRRLKRAGIQNAQITLPDSPVLKQLKKQMDWVLVDAPCSGTGTIRRNPDMKWNFSKEILLRLQGEQRTIFEKALSFLKPTGKIVFATCSLLKEENEMQVEHFLKTYPLKLSAPFFKTLPSPGNMDGFFAAIFQIDKTSSIKHSLCDKKIENY